MLNHSKKINTDIQRKIPIGEPTPKLNTSTPKPKSVGPWPSQSTNANLSVPKKDLEMSECSKNLEQGEKGLTFFVPVMPPGCPIDP